EISPSRNPALLQHHMSAVVPAHAGTHIPEAGVHGSPLSRGRQQWGGWYEALQKLFRNFGPLLAAAIEQRLFAVLRQVCSIAPTKSPDALAASPERLVPETQERAFDRPHVFSSKPPIVRSQPAQIEQPISGDASGEVDVRVEIAHGERTQRTKDRLSPVQAR